MPLNPPIDGFHPWSDPTASLAIREARATQALVRDTIDQLRHDLPALTAQWRGGARDDFDVQVARLLGALADLDAKIAGGVARIQDQAAEVARLRALQGAPAAPGQPADTPNPWCPA